MLAFFASLLLSIVATGASLPLPSLVTVLFVPIAISLLTPLLPVMLFCYGLSQSQTSADRAAVRRVDVRDLAASTLLIATAGLVAVGCSRLGLWPQAGGYVRNLLGFMGLSMLAAPLVGMRFAGLLPVSIVLGASLFGATHAGSARWWAWPIAAPDSTTAAALALLTLLVGLVTYASTARKDPLIHL